MAKRQKHIIPRQVSNAVNSDLVDLQDVQDHLAELQRKEGEIADRIRQSFRKASIVFIDMVGSTKFKLDYQDSPEIWIRRVYLFCEIVTQYVEVLNGRVIKYIGDEVMAVFECDSGVNEASSLFARIKEIEGRLKAVIGIETRIKIAMDYGDVCFLEYPGHDEIDPQGTAVDRCARIAKYTKEGVVLASFDFVKECPSTFNWLEVGQVDLKGIGSTTVYQMGEKTVNVVPVVEIREDEYHKINESLSEVGKANQAATLEIKRLCEMNQSLQEQLRQLGRTPEESNAVFYEENEASPWDEIQEIISELRNVINDAPAPPNEYARFLFLYYKRLSDNYNSLEGRDFRDCIESQLVVETEGDAYVINRNHKRNTTAIAIMSRLEEALENYDSPDEDLYEYSLEDPEFWRENVGYSVR